MTDAKCPKCKSRSFLMEDIRETSYIYTVEDGVVYSLGVGDDGKVIKTICTCAKCGYKWSKRKLEFSIDC